MMDRYALKRVAAWGLLRSGIVSLRRARRAEKTAIVLMYHRVNDEQDPYFPALPLKTFNEQLRYLDRHYSINPLEEVVQWLQNSGSPGTRVAITFDDGYPDTYREVLPELERNGIPATVFLATAPVETGLALWNDRVRSSVKYATAKTASAPPLGLEGMPLETEGDRLQTLRSLLDGMKTLTSREIEGLTDYLEETLVPSESGVEVLSWDHVRRMTKGPIRLGAHTHHHYLLSRLEDSEVENEIRTSATLIHERTGLAPRTFAYPNGELEDYDSRSIACLRRLGFVCAVNTVSGFARPTQNPFELPRIYTSERSMSLFAARLEGFSKEIA